jgi:hypothetical protein
MIRTQRKTKLKGVAELKQENASKLTFTCQSHSHHSTLPISRSRQILINSVHIVEPFDHHERRVVSVLLSCKRLLSSLVPYSRLEFQLVGRFAQRKAETVASSHLPKSVINVFRDRSATLGPGSLLVVYEFHYTHTMIRRRPETSVPTNGRASAPIITCFSMVVSAYFLLQL